MPTTRIGPYKFRFYSSDRDEPPHMHVIRESKVAKLWLSPVSLQYNQGYRASEINTIMRLILDNREELLEAWYAYFSK